METKNQQERGDLTPGNLYDAFDKQYEILRARAITELRETYKIHKDFAKKGTLPKGMDEVMFLYSFMKVPWIINFFAITEDELKDIRGENENR